MRYAITGATGLIGSTLAESLHRDGHEVVRITRHPTLATDIGWDPANGALDRGKLGGFDAVVHLAGEPIGAARWTASVRRRIRESRVESTRLLAETLAEVEGPPAVLVSGSAVGVYGDRGDETLTETSALGDDFLATVCAAWEAAADPARDAGIRVVHPRTGVVIAAEGPLIDKVRLPFRLGVGGRIGSGRQFVPWIALDDHVRALRYLVDSGLQGPVNVVGPEAVSNRVLTRELGRVFRRPAVLPIPVIAIRALYGEMGVSLATASQRVVPEKLPAAGFTYQYPTIGAALDAALAP